MQKASTLTDYGLDLYLIREIATQCNYFAGSRAASMLVRLYPLQLTYLFLSKSIYPTKQDSWIVSSFVPKHRQTFQPSSPQVPI
eukprot:m.1148675 g.1148675  ORF g.1148675 m.1148675 type:complete len:84 (+) comp24476_c0_seq9:5001-5252(+)